MKKSQLSQAALSLLAATLLISNTAWAETATPAQGTTTTAATALKLRFPDVSATHWALKHITKLALLGVVEGNDLGQYEPEASVTQEQVITMAIRMMGLEEEAKKINTSSYVLPFDLSDYAKAYVILAIEKGLIDPVEESAIAQQGSGIWGARPATREWVAKLSIRTIGKQNDAKLLEGVASSFTDNNSISAWARGYINEAVELKIVDGMEDGSFQPKSTVTRAQMATFLSRAGQYASVPEARAAVGVVTAVDWSSLALTDENGSDTILGLTSDTVYYGLQQEKPMSLSDLKTNNQVFVIHNNGKAYYVEVLKEEAKPVLADTVEGTLVRVDAAAAQLTLQLDDGRSAVLDLDVGFQVVDMDGKGVAFSSLAPGYRLEVTRTGSKAKYTSILVKEIPINKTADGVVRTLDITGKKLVVDEPDAGTVEYSLADDVVYMQNGVEGVLSVVKARDVVRYTVTNNLVTSLEMVKPYEDPSDNGKLIDFHVESNHSYITIQHSDNSYATYNLNASVPVLISGLSFARLDDLMKGDEVKVSLDESKSTVTQVTVTNRSILTTYFNTIVSYNASKKLLTVIDGNGKPAVFQLNDNTQVTSDNAALPLSTAASYLTEGKKVDITSNQDTAMKVRLGFAYDGTIVRKDAALNEVTVKTDGEQTLSFKVMLSTRIVLPGVANATIADLAEGDRIRINLISTQDAVGEVLVNKSLSYRVISVDTTKKELKLKDGIGNTSSIILTGSEPIIGTADHYITIGDIPVGEPLSVSFTGSIVKQVKLQKAVRGKVTAVDPGAGKLTVLDAHGVTQTIHLGASGNTIRSATGTAVALSAIKPNDRVELYPNIGGSYVVQVAQVLTRTVDSYKALEKLLYVKRPSLSDPTSYAFHENAYVHKGTETMLPNFLMPNDIVNLYLIDNKVVELEKQ